MKSISDAQENKLLSQINADMSVLCHWIDDTMEPIFQVSKQKSILYEMQSEIEEHIEKKGSTAKSESSLKRINELIELNESLFKAVSSQRMMQLAAQQTERRMSVVAEENRKYKKRIEQIEAEWK